MALEPQLAGDTTCALRAPFAAHTLQALLAPGDPGLALAATTLAAAALVLLQAHRLLLDPPLGCLRTFPLLLFSFASVTAASTAAAADTSIAAPSVALVVVAAAWWAASCACCRRCLPWASCR
jgi:hypothetical protein